MIRTIRTAGRTAALGAVALIAGLAGTVAPKPANWRFRAAIAVAATTAGLLGLPALAQATTRPPVTAAPAITAYKFATHNNPVDPGYNNLHGINSKGVIAGYYGSPPPPPGQSDKGYPGGRELGQPDKGYLLYPPYGPSDYVNENFPGSAQTQVMGINNLGDTAGVAIAGDGDDDGWLLWNSAWWLIHHPWPCNALCEPVPYQAYGVDDAGIAVGDRTNPAGDSVAVRVNHATGAVATITVPGSVSSVATAINNDGDIVGTGTTGAAASRGAARAGSTFGWLLHDGHLTTLQFPGSSYTQALGINDHGEIVGDYRDSSGLTHGFVLTDPLSTLNWQTVDDPSGVGSTVVNGVNDAGELVGFYVDSAGNTNGMLAIP